MKNNICVIIFAIFLVFVAVKMNKGSNDIKQMRYLHGIKF